jgi:acyl-coenzyme A thioesterase PaaI-like protein
MKLFSPGRITARRLRRVLNAWPPFLFAGIRVTHLGEDWRSARVELRLRWWNRNYVGTHFGGSLFAMTDPFWMLLVMQSLGREYVVWDRAGEIDFRKPGRGTVRAEFALEDAALHELRDATRDGDKALRWFEVPVIDAQGDVVALVRKQLYVRRKRA